SMDRCDSVGRQAVVRAFRHIGMAGYSAPAVDVFRAHRPSITRLLGKNEFGWLDACTPGDHSGSYGCELYRNCISDFLSSLYAAKYRSRPGCPGPLFRHYLANCHNLPLSDCQYRFTPWRTRNDRV